MQYMIGSWYRKDELAKRSCIFHASGFIGNMFSGYLMAAVYNLSGVNGLKGWQWLFIVDGIISLPIAVAGFFLLPDVPEITKAFYLKPEEVAIAKKRMEHEGRAERAPYTKAKIKKILSSWHIYLLPLLYTLFSNATGGMSQPTFQLWLKSEGYSVRDINVYPALSGVIGVVSTLAYAWASDTICNGARWPPIIFAAVVNIIGYGSLAGWNISTGWKWFCYYSQALAGGAGGVSYAWAAEITGGDSEERAIITAAMNQAASVVQAWLPLLVWQVIEAPRYFKGFTTMTVFWVVFIGVVFLIRHLDKRERAVKAASLAQA
jgi:MFS transporter, ACS family, pantothenate transporter